MKSKIFNDDYYSVKLVIRSFIYSSVLGTILFCLIVFHHNSLFLPYIGFAILGLLVLITDLIFTIYYTRPIEESKRKDFYHHAFNHLVYPFFQYIGMVSFIYNEQNESLTISLATVSFIAFFLQLYLLPTHLFHDIENHKDLATSTSRTDLLMHVFKFVSYFTFNLALFQAFSLYKLSIETIAFANLAINFLYLFLHLNRLKEINSLNVFMAVLFSIITTIFIIQSKTVLVNFSAVIATLLFYLSAGIFYNKVDGTFSNKIMIEYCTIAIILSVFIFSI